MHLACRYGSPRNAVKLVLPQAAWHSNGSARPFSTSPTYRYQHAPKLHPDNLLGSYKENTIPNQSAKNIAVIGGGISGLATAFNLTKDIPNAKITLFEAKEKLGGWVDSEQVEVDDGKVLFEWGPRTLRPDTNGNGRATLQLINQLGEELKSSIRGISYSHPAATNRYIYYPDHLVRMPGPNPNAGMLSTVFGTLRTLLSEPAFSGVIRSLVAEPTVECRSDNVKDESVGSFVTRRFGTAVADNLLSALFHGIYAGDIHKLSARTLLPSLWYLENRDRDGNGVVMEAMELFFRGHLLQSFDRVRFINRFLKDRVGDPEAYNFLHHQMKRSNVYSFVKGIGQLTDTLLDNLNQNPNVTIEANAKVSGLAFDASNRKWSISTDAKSNSEAANKFDYAVWTLSPQQLYSALDQPNTASQTQTHDRLKNALQAGSPKAVNVMVVNLYYKNPDLPLPHGFGYLIPRSVPAEENPERALGVIFASETAGPRGKAAFQTVVEQRDEDDKSFKEKLAHVESITDEEEKERLANELLKEDEGKTFDIQLGHDTASGTKLGVMLGGHWWEGWAESDLPSEEEAIKMAKSVIERHLGITEEPMLAKARLQNDCIPQYQVGYRDDMAKIHKELVNDFEGRLKVGGPWWQGGVGFNDCVRGGRDTSRRIREGWDEETGLEGYVGEEKWVLIDRRTGTQVMDPLRR